MDDLIILFQVITLSLKYTIIVIGELISIQTILIKCTII